MTNSPYQVAVLFSRLEFVAVVAISRYLSIIATNRDICDLSRQIAIFANPGDLYRYFLNLYLPVNQAHELCWDAVIHERLMYHLGQDGVQMSGMAYILWNVTMQHKPTLDPGLDLVSVRHVTLVTTKLKL